MTRRMLYINDDGRCSPFSNQNEMIHAIKKDTKSKPAKVTIQQKLGIQQVIADAIKECGGGLYEDNGEIMDDHINMILAIIGARY